MTDIENLMDLGEDTPNAADGKRGPQNFTETSFVARFSEHIAAGEPEKALDHLIGKSTSAARIGDAPEGMNRLRKSEHLEAITSAGFEILQERPREGDIPPETVEALLPRRKNMSKSDIDTFKLSVMFRKPAL